MAKIDEMMTDPGADVYYTAGLRDVLEDHMTYLRNHPRTQAIAVSPIQAHKYEHDLTGLLNLLGVPMTLHWTVMRMNNLDTLTHVPADLTQLLIPEIREVGLIQQTYSSQTVSA